MSPVGRRRSAGPARLTRTAAAMLRRAGEHRRAPARRQRAARVGTAHAGCGPARTRHLAVERRGHAVPARVPAGVARECRTWPGPGLHDVRSARTSARPPRPPVERIDRDGQRWVLRTQPTATARVARCLVAPGMNREPLAARLARPRPLRRARSSTPALPQRRRPTAGCPVRRRLGVLGRRVAVLGGDARRSPPRPRPIVSAEGESQPDASPPQIRFELGRRDDGGGRAASSARCSSAPNKSTSAWRPRGWRRRRPTRPPARRSRRGVR